MTTAFGSTGFAGSRYESRRPNNPAAKCVPHKDWAPAAWWEMAFRDKRLLYPRRLAEWIPEPSEKGKK